MLMPVMVLSAILAVVYAGLRMRDAARAKRRPTSPRRGGYSRPPQHAPQRPAPEARRDARPQHVRVMDLHHRGAIFAVTKDQEIEGYTLSPLGIVRVDGGPAGAARLARAAAQAHRAANAVTGLHLRAGGDLCGLAVRAEPQDTRLAAPKYRPDLRLIDGSNVMHWFHDAGLADAPSLAPVAAVLTQLRRDGVRAGVVFDASAGHVLEGRFVGHDELAARLPEAEDVLVVDKGTQADWTLIQMARDEGMIIISNDHYRDSPAARHLLKQKGYVDGSGVRLLEPRA